MGGSDPYDILRVVEAVLGREVAAEFHARVAGRRVRIPKNRVFNKNSVFSLAAGSIENAMVIHSELMKLGIIDLDVSIPLGERGVHVQRAALIKSKLLAGGQSVGQIAVDVGVTERTVFSYRAQLLAAGVKLSKVTSNPEGAFSEIQLDILTSPSLDRKTIEEIAARYDCTVKSIDARIERLRQRGALSRSTAR